MRFDKDFAARAALCMAAGTCPAHAAASDADALSLPVLSPADAPAEPAGEGLLKGLRLELAGQRVRSADGLVQHTGRGVADYRREWRTAQGLRFTLSDRLEASRDFTQRRGEWRNALREAFVSSSIGARMDYLDAGRMMVRGGSAAGYNPTDYFKAGASIEQATFDPVALRENRLGTAMLRLQQVRGWGSATLGYAPRLSSRDVPSDSPVSLGLDRTNRRQAAYLKLSPALGERLSADLSAYGRSGEKPRAGLSASALMGEAVVANLEWSGSRGTALPGPGEEAAGDAWRQRWSANLSWTLPGGMNLTLEREYAGDALSRGQWDAWRAASGAQREPLAGLVAQRLVLQEPLMRDNWFARAVWVDALGQRGLDLSGFVRRNAYDGSRLWQVDAAWHAGPRWSLSALAGRFEGDAVSQYGASPVRSYASVSFTFHLE